MEALITAAPSRADLVAHALSHVGHMLPDQAPLRVFIYHNTLHAFQKLHFHDAVLKAHEVYGAEPYLSEARFRALLRSGRISHADLEAALEDVFPDDPNPALVGELLDLHTLRTLLLRHAVCSETPASLHWKIDELDFSRRLRADVPSEARARFVADSARWLRLVLEPGTERAALQFAAYVTGEEAEPKRIDALMRAHGLPPAAQKLRAALDEAPEEWCVAALWQACRNLAKGYEPATDAKPICGRRQHRDALLSRTGQDVYDLVFPALIRLTAAYLDEGLAATPMPDRPLGFYRAVRALIAHGSPAVAPWEREARLAFAAQEQRQASALEVVLAALDELGIQPDEIESYLEHMLLTLPGWAGMMSRLERHPDDRPQGGPPSSLLDFLAVRLVYECAALRVTAREHLGTSQLSSLVRDAPESAALPAGDHDGAARLFVLMQLAGVPVPRVRGLSVNEAHDILRAMDATHELVRRRIFQEAFERHYRCEILDALAEHRKHGAARGPHGRPRFQLIACFDEREESFRRQLEEVEPKAQTFGAPGFFGAAIRFRAVDARDSVPLAPVLIEPTHEIDERPRPSDVGLQQTRAGRRHLLARFNEELHRGSRSLWRGMILNTALGLLALLPLLTRIVSPRIAGRIHRFSSTRLLPSPRTELTLHHEALGEHGIVADTKRQRGFKQDERVARVATLLENLGFTKTFSKLVVVLGHGASTLNNPHKSAYDCGACGGRQGGPNARIFCEMANEPAVRQGLAERGIQIPEDTWFVGGQHDTCNDVVTLLDTELVPATHRELLGQASDWLDRARARTAQERCRRLFSAPQKPTLEQALRHVEARSEHLAEPTPEFGHATNAVAIIGRRALSRGLFLDRRAFLLSYDPTLDPDGKILERTLATATPICAGINLEYYFSHVDNDRYGAGSKLPHNITGLIGVMSGHASDLRTGLPRQMIEIHEAMRLLVIVEATPERLAEVAGRQTEVRELVAGRWIQLVSLDPDSGAMQVFTDRGFVPYSPREVKLPQADSSRAFYLGHSGFLPPARIRERSQLSSASQALETPRVDANGALGKRGEAHAGELFAHFPEATLRGFVV